MKEKRTIGRAILENTLAAARLRLEKLEKIGAPSEIVDTVKGHVGAMEAGVLRIGGDTLLLNEKYASVEWKKGRGGKPFAEFNETILYFPLARYGRYITRKEHADA